MSWYIVDIEYFKANDTNNWIYVCHMLYNSINWSHVLLYGISKWNEDLNSGLHSKFSDICETTLYVCSPTEYDKSLTNLIRLKHNAHFVLLPSFKENYFIIF